MCYIVSEYKRLQEPEIHNIFRTIEEAKEYILNNPSQRLGIKEGTGEWLNIPLK